MYTEDLYRNLFNKINQIHHLENSLEESNLKINQLNQQI